MGHEAVCLSARARQRMAPEKLSHLVMRSSIDRGSRMKVGSVTRLRSAPGRSCDMMCESTAAQSYVSQLLSRVQLFSKRPPRTAALLCIDDGLIFLGDLVASGFVDGGSRAACVRTKRKS